jgi:hypothetical protein
MSHAPTPTRSRSLDQVAHRVSALRPSPQSASIVEGTRLMARIVATRAVLKCRVCEGSLPTPPRGRPAHRTMFHFTNADEPIAKEVRDTAAEQGDLWAPATAPRQFERGSHFGESGLAFARPHSRLALSF